MGALNVGEALAKVYRGSAVIIFDNSDDAISFISFCNIVQFAYGVELPIDVSVFFKND